MTEGNSTRGAIEQFPILDALLPQLQATHSAIIALRAQVEDPKVRELSEQQCALDADDDGRVRDIYGALTGLAQVSAAAAELIGLRDELFPEALGGTQVTYRGQAGHGAMVGALMDDKLQWRLRAVSLHDKNLLDLTNEWLDVAKQIGQLEDERASWPAVHLLARGPPHPRTSTTPASPGSASSTPWSRAPSWAASTPPATTSCSPPQRAAETTADSRGKGKAAPAAAATTAAPTPTGTAP